MTKTKINKAASDSHWRSRSLFLREDVSTLLVQDGVDTTEGGLRALDFDHVDGFLETRVGEEGGGVTCTSARGDDLSTTTVDGIGVEGDIENVESDTSHVLLSAHTFLLAFQMHEISAKALS